MKGIKKSIGEDLYKSLYPQGSQPGIMYGSSKIHKPLANDFPKLRPILSALNTGTYKWAKFLVPLLQHLTSNEFTLKDSSEFAKIICEQDAGLLMASLDVDSLFTNSLLRKPSIFALMSYSKVIVVFMVLIKNKLPRCFL